MADQAFAKFFAGPFQQALERAEIPDLPDASWDRKAAYLLYRATDGGKSWRVEHHTDPVEALKLALTERTFQTADEDIFA